MHVILGDARDTFATARQLFKVAAVQRPLRASAPAMMSASKD
jgi:hypothetical protein